MSLNRPFFVAAACVTSLSFIACGSSNSPPAVDASVGPSGMHYSYVVGQALLPTTQTQYALDLGDRTSSKLDGIVDNQFGIVFGALSILKFPIQDTVTAAVDQGKLLLLVDLQTTDFTNAIGAGLSVKLGDPSGTMPPACSSATDTSCRHQLDGNAMFKVAADSPKDAALGGKVVNGTFDGGPGNLSLQIALGSTTPIALNLINARAKATSITNAGMTAVLGGMVTTQEIDTHLLPAIQLQLVALEDRDCPAPRTEPTCNCIPDSTGALIIAFLKPAGCVISIDAIKGNNTVKALLSPDVCTTSSCGAPDALSFGVQVQAVKATF